jgi:hypothetical protein
MIILLSKSNKPNKKYSVNIDGKNINFGDSNYGDYTQYNNIHQKELYLTRHASREDWNDPLTAGFWSRWLLWNKKSISKSIKDIKKRFGIKIINLI